MRRAFDLNIAPRAERHHLPLRDPQLELFNESGFVIVRDNFTLPFFDAENLFRQFNLHVLLHRHLTGQTATGFGIPLGNMRKLGRQDIPAALFNSYPTLAAGAAAAAGGGDEDPVAGQRVQQFVTRRGADLFIRFVIDLNNHVARVHQL